MSEYRERILDESGHTKPLLWDRLREEWEELGMLSYTGGQADLTADDIIKIRQLIREAGWALEAYGNALDTLSRWPLEKTRFEAERFAKDTLHGWARTEA